MKRTDFYYDLPEELIAQEPLKDRSSSRLMILDKNTGEIEHKHFYDIVDELNEGDALILNDTKVLPARLYGQKEGTGGAIEFLLLHKHTPVSYTHLYINVRKMMLSKPKGYKEEDVQALLSNADSEEQTTVDKEEMPNIIAIMNESFSDLNVVGDLQTSEDYMPFIHSMTKNTIKRCV